MKNLRPILVLGGLGVIGYALYRYYRKQINFLKDITYQITGVTIRGISANSVSLDITAKIYNASNVEATVKEMYLDIFVNGTRVGNVNEIKDILVLPQQTTNVSFNFQLNPKVIGKNVVDLITSTIAAKDVIFDIKGYIKVKSSFITTTLPFEYQNNLKSMLKR